MDTCRSWLFNGLIIVFVSLFFSYKSAGMEDSTMWTPGGASWNQSYGSHLSSGKTYSNSKAGYQTNSHAFLFLPVAGALAYFAAANSAPKRQKRIAWVVVVMTTISVLITKDGNWSGMGFYLGIVGIGCTIYALRIAGKLVKDAKVRSTTPAA